MQRYIEILQVLENKNSIVLSNLWVEEKIEGVIGWEQMKI